MGFEPISSRTVVSVLFMVLHPSKYPFPSVCTVKLLSFFPSHINTCIFCDFVYTKIRMPQRRHTEKYLQVHHLPIDGSKKYQ